MSSAPHRSALIAAAALLAIPGLASAATAQQGEVHADLVSESGARIASLTGNVGPRGTGWGRLAPLSGAAAYGFKRPEEVKLYAKHNGTVFVSGQRGTAIRVTDRTRGGAVGGGIINIADKKLRTIGVNASGSWTRQPFHPVKGQTMLVIGNTGGTIRTALGRRYKLVAYRADTYSRAQLIANPSRYAKIAGLLIGPDVTAKQLNSLDLARSLHNEGRLVATAGNPKVLDRHMFSVAHMHLGRHGVILRRESVPLGRMVHAYPQIREPIITHSKVGGAKRLSEAATFTTARRKAAANAALVSLNRALAGSERVSAPTKPRKGMAENQSASTNDPATVTAGSDGAAYYTVPVNQYISATITAPSVVLNPFGVTGLTTVTQIQDNVSTSGMPSMPAGFATGACFSGYATDSSYTYYGWVCALPPGGGYSNCTVVSSSGNFWSVNGLAGNSELTNESTPLPAYVTWSCTGTPNNTSNLSQTVGITYNPIYTVSLAQSTSTVTQQAISETNAAQFNAVATSSTPMAAGTFNNTSTQVSYGAAPVSGDPEAAFGLAMAYHSVNLLCSTCVGTSGGTITPAFEAGASAPTQQITQVSGGSSTGTSTNTSNGTNWENSNSTTSSWNVSGTIGLFGPIPTGSITAGGGQSYTQSSSTGGNSTYGTGTSLQSSTNYTLSNWTTSPVQGATQAQYTTYSTTLVGASGSQASAAYSLPFPANQTGNSAGFLATESSYGGNGPGPTCSPGAGCAPPQLSPQPLGSGMNMTGFTQGSTSTFTLDSSGNQLSTGSASPMVNDTFYLFDQGSSSGSPVGAYIELQVLGQSSVAVAEPLAGAAPTVSTTTSGSSGTSGITTYYNAQGQVVNSASGAAYSTTGLDLCAPPVLTPALWNAGCQDDPSFAGPPSVYASGPVISTKSTNHPITTNSTTGQAEVASPAPTLACSTGSWSGSPAPTYTYQWQQWNAMFGNWNNISGATASTYQPSSSLSTDTYFLCAVTAKNTSGSATTASPSVEVIVG